MIIRGKGDIRIAISRESIGVFTFRELWLNLLLFQFPLCLQFLLRVYRHFNLEDGFGRQGT